MGTYLDATSFLSTSYSETRVPSIGFSRMCTTQCAYLSFLLTRMAIRLRSAAVKGAKNQHSCRVGNWLPTYSIHRSQYFRYSYFQLYLGKGLYLIIENYTIPAQFQRKDVALSL